jgi:CRISPR/Cas system CMR-associated protein Cmr3 (group 5 of RAMP superfamily)
MGERFSIVWSNIFHQTKAKAAEQLYTENGLLKEIGVVAVDTIERKDEEIEFKDNKINVLEKELKDVNHYHEQKIQTLLNKKPVIRNKVYWKRFLINDNGELINNADDELNLIDLER